MNFDLDTAWRDVRRLAGENRKLLLAIAGIFIFIPYASLLILLPSIAPMPEPPQGAPFSVVMASIREFYASSWWAFALLTLAITIGQLAMLALIERKPGPTVGEAIGMGAKACLPAWLALLLQSLAINLATALIVAIAAVTGVSILVFLATVAALVLALYLTTRFSLVLPIMASENYLNPIGVLKKSWDRTRGHAARMLAFYVLIGVAAVVTAIVVVMIPGVALALFGEQVAESGGMIVSAIIVTAMMILFTLVLASVNRQLVRLGRGASLEPVD